MMVNLMMLCVDPNQQTQSMRDNGRVYGESEQKPEQVERQECVRGGGTRFWGEIKDFIAEKIKYTESNRCSGCLTVTLTTTTYN